MQTGYNACRSEGAGKELKHALPGVQCLALVPEHITGKLVNES